MNENKSRRGPGTRKLPGYRNAAQCNVTIFVLGIRFIFPSHHQRKPTEACITEKDGSTEANGPVSHSPAGQTSEKFSQLLRAF